MFEIIKCGSIHLCIPKTNERLDEYLDEVCEQLDGSSGEVVFDLLLSNGYRHDRFVSGNFNKESGFFDMNSFKILSGGASEEIRKVLRQYYLDNPGLLDNNNDLSKSQKYLIRKFG